jgi:hypothetical protein
LRLVQPSASLFHLSFYYLLASRVFWLVKDYVKFPLTFSVLRYQLPALPGPAPAGKIKEPFILNLGHQAREDQKVDSFAMTNRTNLPSSSKQGMSQSLKKALFGAALLALTWLAYYCLIPRLTAVQRIAMNHNTDLL